MEELWIALCGFEDGLSAGLALLREQQAVVPMLHGSVAHADTVKLLSTSLRTFAWLEDQRNALIEGIGEYLPLQNANWSKDICAKSHLCLGPP